jgi:palmitoyltransferase ZDHHC9/14/18
MEVPTKYCKSCNIWRPPRAHHCRVCDACIETQDHHCVWLNNCVGRRNYRFFFSYVAFASLLALLLLAFSIAHVVLYGKRNGISFSASLSGRTQERVAFAMVLYSILALPYPGSLFGYHLFLIARGETTREYLNSHKFLKKDRHRPFSQSDLLRNWMSVIMRPRPPTYLQFKHPYASGDARMGHTVPKKQRKRDLKNRYSTTAPAGGGANGNSGGMEMKSLPPLPPNTASTQAQPNKPQVRSPTTGDGTGVVDRTPR